MAKENDRLFLINTSVYVVLGNDKPRKIGSLMNDTFICHRTREKHLHRILNSYGFNWKLFNSDAIHIKRVELVDDFGRYAFSADIVRNGTVKRFKDSNDLYDVQYFVPLATIESFKV